MTRPTSMPERGSAPPRVAGAPSRLAALAPLVRYAAAAAGPAATAGAQFVLALVVLKRLDPGAFGRFSLLITASQFSWGMWSALFCAPMPALAARAAGAAERAGILRTLLSTNLLGAGCGFAAFAALSLALGLPPGAALLFGGYAALALLRWFARAYAYVQGRFWRAVASDAGYSLALLGMTAMLIATGRHGLGDVSGALLAATFLSLIPFGAAYLRTQFGGFDRRAVMGYGAVWRDQSAWSLLGVVAIEATANAHTYVVTALAGPGAFAPLAAAALAVRPMNVLTNALTDLERTQLARNLADGAGERVRSGLRLFRLALILAWIANAALVAAILRYAPHAVLSARYDVGAVAAAAAAWLAIAGIRLARAPESALLQASGAFRMLALLGLAAGGVSLVSVTGLLLVAGPFASLGGIALGEAAFAVGVHRAVRRVGSSVRPRHRSGSRRL